MAGFALAALVATGLGGCGSSKSAYPALRDIPPPPAALTPEAVRESLKADLTKERSGESAAPAGPKPRKEPAVPPKKPQGQSSSLEDQEASALQCEAPGGTRLAQAIPPLRGTLREPDRREPEGVTAATGKLPEGPLQLRFEPGTADLAAAFLDALRARSAAFLAEGGGDVFIDVRGTPPEAPNAVRSLTRLQLGLRRASFVADYLIAQGIASERIKLLVTEADGKAGGNAELDGAQVIFRHP
jgi:outer membrane protein OmpA-like peptidoglycan-associated protein